MFEKDKKAKKVLATQLKLKETFNNKLVEFKEIISKNQNDTTKGIVESTY